jgi:hypothetical protein
MCASTEVMGAGNPCWGSEGGKRGPGRFGLQVVPESAEGRALPGL